MAFDLQSITSTRRARAPKIVIAGPGKVGKTTFAAGAPNSIGILTEEGADAVDAQAFPPCASLNDVYAAMGTLLHEEHEFQSLFVDSLDWTEPLINAHVCAANGWNNIEAPGFGKGYLAAAEEWRTFLQFLEQIRSQRNMAVILICHDKVKRFEDPTGEGYDHYTLKLHDRATALVQEWADVIGWANHASYVRHVDAGFNKKEAKAVGTGERILHVEPAPAHMGGNRFGLKNMQLGWSHFAAAMAARSAT